MRVRVLGPMRIRCADGTAVPLGTPKQRHVCALLLVRAGRLVTVDELVDELWPERPPPSSIANVRTYAARLRRAFADRDSGVRIEPRGQGYALHIETGSFDLDAYRRELRHAREARQRNDPARAVEHYATGHALWTGGPLEDVPDGRALADWRQSIREEAAAAAEEWAVIDLELGHGALVVSRLREHVAAHPLRERGWELLIRALHTSGDVAGALAAYGRARAALVDQLGLEPGAELQALHQAILRGEHRTEAVDPRRTPATTRSAAAAPPMPAQLPADVIGFVGRDEQLRRLDSVLAATGAAASRTLVISGTAGVGKTALAQRWAHRVRHRFPGGQLYVDLRGHAAGPPLRPVEALGRFLHAVGLHGDQVPVDVDEAAAMYRTMLADRRVLVILDNARSAEQVRPLLPGSAGSFTVVTSRNALTGLVARQGAVAVDLEVLSPAEAEALLANVLGPERLRAEPDAAAELARLCGRLPLAVRIAAANLAMRPDETLASYAATLRSKDRLDLLAVDADDQAAVGTAFELSYRGLTDGAQRMFRLFGTVPGPDLTVEAAAALADVPVAEAAALLGQLVDAHLVGCPSPGRYAMHDLLQLYAARSAAEGASAADLHAAMTRLYRYYLHTADAAARLLYPHLIRLPVSGAASGGDAEATPAFKPPWLAAGAGPDPAAGNLTERDAALAWFEAERANLVAAIRSAADRGPAEYAWRLADAVRGYFYLRMYTVNWTSVVDAARSAAQADGGPTALASHHLSEAMLPWRQGRHREAEIHYEQTRVSARAAGWLEGETAAVGSLGNLHRQGGRLNAAAQAYDRARVLSRSSGHLGAEATAIGNLGLVYWEQGRLTAAVEQYTRAIDLYRLVGSISGEAIVTANLGDALRALGRLDQATEAIGTARALNSRVGHSTGDSDMIRCLAAIHHDAGHARRAIALARQALELARESGHRRYQANALNLMASAEHHLRAYRAAARLYRDALDTVDAGTDRLPRLGALVGLAGATAQLGELAEAAELAQSALTTAAGHGYRIAEARAHLVLAEVSLAAGEPTRAVYEAEQALKICRDCGFRLGQANSRLRLGDALAQSGDAAGASRNRRTARRILAAIRVGAPSAE
jgi:DNA-binding SARP family transcriptional activator